MALGSPQDVSDAVAKAFNEIRDHKRIIWSVGGGMAPDVRDENILAFIKAVSECSS
jgi:uroporphyrinogen-III decarboxylase